jgi:tol-pal system protein YbgF
LSRYRSWIFPLAGGALVALSGCATQSDMQLVRQDIRAAQTQAADAKAGLDTLRRELEILRGEVEQVRFDLTQAGRSEDVVAHMEALDSRIAAIEHSLRAGVPPVVAPETGEVLPPPLPGPDLVSQSLEAEIATRGLPEEYRQGLELLRAGQQREAIQRLREFLRRSPRSELADNAQYWIGEAYYAMRDYNRAILEFNEVLLRYPRGDKVPAALLRQAYAFADLGDQVDARLVLQKLVSEHGNTPEADLGRQKLAELSS